jgi:hypothetical protein
MRIEQDPAFMKIVSCFGKPKGGHNGENENSDWYSWTSRKLSPSCLSENPESETVTFDTCQGGPSHIPIAQTAVSHPSALLAFARPLHPWGARWSAKGRAQPPQPPRVLWSGSELAQPQLLGAAGAGAALPPRSTERSALDSEPRGQLLGLGTPYSQSDSATWCLRGEWDRAETKKPVHPRLTGRGQNSQMQLYFWRRRKGWIVSGVRSPFLCFHTHTYLLWSPFHYWKFTLFSSFSPWLQWLR